MFPFQVHTVVYSLTSESAIELGVGGHFEARMWQQEAFNFGETGVDVLPHILQLLVLVLLNLSAGSKQAYLLFSSQV